MSGEEIREYIERLLRELSGIRDSIDATNRSIASMQSGLAIGLVLVAVLVAVLIVIAAAALVFARRAVASVERLVDTRATDVRREEREQLGRTLRDYSESLGIQAVTGREPARGETAAEVRRRLDTDVALSTQPGLSQLIHEISVSRVGVAELPQEKRAAENGLIAIAVQWSLERWIADPEGWLADSRERARLELAGRLGDE